MYRRVLCSIKRAGAYNQTSFIHIHVSMVSVVGCTGRDMLHWIRMTI